LLLLLLAALPLPASNALLTDGQVALNLLRKIAGFTRCFAGLNDACLSSLSPAAQNTALLVSGLESLLHLAHLQRLLLLDRLRPLPGSAQTPPLKGIPGEQNLLQFGVQLLKLAGTTGCVR